MKKNEIIKKILPLTSKLKMFYWSCDNYIDEIFNISSTLEVEKHKIIVKELEYFNNKYGDCYSGDSFINIYDNINKLAEKKDCDLKATLKQFEKELEMILEYHFWLIKIKKDLIKN